MSITTIILCHLIEYFKIIGRAKEYLTHAEVLELSNTAEQGCYMVYCENLYMDIPSFTA